MQKKTGYMSRSLFERCVNQLSEMGLDILCLHFGGESLLHPEFEYFLKYAIKKRDHGEIRSVNWTENGMLFDQRKADLVVNLKVDLINFSLDGIGQVNDNIRLGSKYSIIEKNIKYLLKKRGNAKRPTVKLLVVDCEKTEKQKLEIYREWIHLVDGIDLIPSILPDNTWENKNIISKTLKLAPPPKFCRFPFETIAISWDGKVTGCCLDYVFKMDLGDVTKESIKQIWEGQKFQTLRKSVLSNFFPNDSPCKGCEFWQVNFEHRKKEILEGKAEIEFGYIYRNIRKKV
jgi:radical SAM protein with 4Fe4S-binding SPASM domain